MLNYSKKKKQSNTTALPAGCNKNLSPDAYRASLLLFAKATMATSHTEESILVSFPWSELGDVYKAHSKNFIERTLLTMIKQLRYKKVMRSVNELGDLSIRIADVSGQSFKCIKPLNSTQFTGGNITAEISKDFLRLMCVDSGINLPTESIDIHNPDIHRLYCILLQRVCTITPIPLLNETSSEDIFTHSELRELLNINKMNYDNIRLEKLVIEPTIEVIKSHGFLVEYKKKRYDSRNIHLHFKISRQ